MSEADSARPMPLRGQERPQRGLAGPPQRCGRRRIGQQRLVQRRGLEDLALQRRGRREQAGVDVRQCVGDALLAGALKQRGELQQLEVAHDSMRDVQVGVQPQLAQAAADPGDAREHLVAHQLKRRLELIGRRPRMRLGGWRFRGGGWGRIILDSGGWPGGWTPSPSWSATPTPRTATLRSRLASPAMAAR